MNLSHRDSETIKVIKGVSDMLHGKKYKTLKGTDWKITPSHGYVKLINGERAHISRYYAYTSRKGNDYKTTYKVIKGDKYIGQRNRFKDAMALAEGGE